ncbi:MAG: COG4315 family predicted lipoprotein [Geminicoccaceae bacterium]
MRRYLTTAAIGATALGFGLAGASHAAYAAQGVELQVSDQGPYGEHLADAKGMSVYLFEADSKLSSTCYDACAKAWPPLLAKAEPTAGQGVDKSMLATFKRKDGATQVAYNGSPLYHFVKDKQPGDTKGQDVKGFGAEWYLVSAEGKTVEEEEEEHEEKKY